MGFEENNSCDHLDFEESKFTFIYKAPQTTQPGLPFQCWGRVLFKLYDALSCLVDPKVNIKFSNMTKN